MRNEWTVLQKIEMDGNCAFWKLIILSVFQVSFVWFVMFDIVLGRHICLTQCKAVILSFTSNFSSFRANTSLRSRRLEVMGARKNGAREGDTRGERVRLPKRPMKIVFTRFLRVRKVPIVPISENNISLFIIHGMHSLKNIHFWLCFLRIYSAFG